MPPGSGQSDSGTAERRGAVDYRLALEGMRETTIAESFKRSRFVSARFPRNFNPLRFCEPQSQTSQGRQALIAELAYFRAEKRGFEAGHELEDWLAAEAEVERRLSAGRWQTG